MKRIKKSVLCAVVLCAILISVVIPVCAAGAIDTEKDAAFTVSYENGGAAIPGAKFEIYKVADVDAYAEMTLTERFAGYPIAFDGLDKDKWDELATTLKGYVWTDKLKADMSGETDSTGKMQVTVKPGLYLVLGQPCDIDDVTYTATPFLVFLPDTDAEDNVWDYNVTAYPKSEAEKVPAEDTVTRKVLKIWEDEGKESSRPEEITVYLLCDGKVYDTVKLNAGNNWRYTWEKLENGHDWLVTEDAAAGYTQAITQEGVTFTVKNTVKPETPVDPPKPSDPKLPQTGLLWWPAAVLMVGGLLCVVVGLVKRKGAKSE